MAVGRDDGDRPSLAAWRTGVRKRSDAQAYKTKRFEAVQLVISSTDGGTDIALVTADGAVLAVQVMTIQYASGFSKLLRNQMQELLATSAVTPIRPWYEDK